MAKTEEKKEWQDIIKESKFARGIALVFIFLIFFVILAYIGFYSPPGLGGPQQCFFPTAIQCVSWHLYYATSDFELSILTPLNKTINVTGVVCTQNNNPESIYYGGNHSILIPAGTYVAVAVNDTERSWLKIKCTDTNGNVPDAEIGKKYDGRIYVNYTDVDTGKTGIVVGTLRTIFETR